MTNKTIKSVKSAVELYYTKPFITYKDIAELFGVSASTANTIKKQIAREMKQRGEIFLSADSVNTATAFEVWGLNISDLETMFNKQKELGLNGD